jgi:thiamine phosphate synthase YjbQ (UPF0047 family)
MKSYRKELWFEVPTRVQFVNITRQVNDCLKESGVREGTRAGERDAHHRVGVHQ